MNEATRMHFNISVAQLRLLQRRFAEALSLSEGLKDELFANDLDGLMGKYGIVGIAKKFLGDDAGAREAFLKLKGCAEKWLAEAPNEPIRHDRLAEAFAWLGEKESAIAEAKRATEMLPESVDAFQGPECTKALMEIYMIVGEHDKALEILDGLLTRPSPVTVAAVKVNPLWDAVRQDPRFLAIIQKHGG